MFDPANSEVKIKLHWVLYNVSKVKVQKELEKFSKVSGVFRECFQEPGI